MITTQYSLGGRLGRDRMIVDQKEDRQYKNQEKTNRQAQENERFSNTNKLRVNSATYNG
jgi:hypothetical protein